MKLERAAAPQTNPWNMDFRRPKKNDAAGSVVVFAPRVPTSFHGDEGIKDWIDQYE